MTILTTTIASGPAPAAPNLTEQDRRALSQIEQATRADLSDNILPFWTRDTQDTGGGFNTVVDRTGRPTTHDKYIVMQARMIWTLSAAYSHGVHEKRYLDLAGRAVEFITRHMWDAEYGGFYMQLDRAGHPVDTRKYLYSQEFALYGLSEYARVSHDPEALAWADRVYNLILAKTTDHEHPGYREDFDREWTPIAESLGVGGTASGKTLNTHMHLMEALTAYVQACTDPAQKARAKATLGSLVDLLLEKTYDPAHGFAREPFTLDWTPKPDDTGKYSSFYGHEVEFAYLLLDAMDALGRPRVTIRPVVLGLIDHAMAYGFDTERGGIAARGPRLVRVDSEPSYEGEPLTKEWWEQAECLTALITAFRWTGERKYLADFEKEWNWVNQYAIDHQDGDWYAANDWLTGAPTRLDKGLGGWKVCYHNGRAMMRVSSEIADLLAAKPFAP